MTATGEVAYFSYSIEFPIRGLPHVHGVFWLQKDLIDKCIVGDEFDDKEIVKLIEKWINCSLNTGDPKLEKLISEVNVHRHTKSCQKGKTS